MKRNMLKISMPLLLLVTLTACSDTPDAAAVTAAADEVTILLADDGVLVDGEAAATDSGSAVYVGAAIIYYEEGQDESYGQGSASDAHSAAAAAAQTVVTITQPGSYRVSGTLSAGQLAVDLGEGAAADPAAVVNLILDGVDIICEIAPAIIFYNVYECGDYDTATAGPVVDTGAAGANIILADGSVNYVTGSHVARIYQEGTTKKLHKYDAAISSKMSLNINPQSAGTGELHVTADYEGIESWLHVTINGGVVRVEALEDGINAGEDDVSVITINDGYIYVNGGIELDGDGLDSNGYLTINGGTVITMANGLTGDGGIDADRDITLNGGTIIALGSRNDAVTRNSAQAYIELSYASTQPAGTVIRIEDAAGNEILTYEPIKLYQSFTYSSPELKLDTVYYVYAGGTVTGATATDGLYSLGGTVTGAVQQQYTGNLSGMMGGPGGMGGGGRGPGGGAPAEGQMADGEAPEWPEGMPEGERPDGQADQPGGFGAMGGMQQSVSGGEGSIEFVLTESIRSFSGVSEAADLSAKTRVTFQVNDGAGLGSGDSLSLTSVTAETAEGQAVSIPAAQIQLTVTDVPSADYAATCLLADGAAALAALLPTDDGQYQLTITVLADNTEYTGTSQFLFHVGTQGPETEPAE